MPMALVRTWRACNMWGMCNMLCCCVAHMQHVVGTQQRTTNAYTGRKHVPCGCTHGCGIEPIVAHCGTFGGMWGRARAHTACSGHVTIYGTCDNLRAGFCDNLRHIAPCGNVGMLACFPLNQQHTYIGTGFACMSTWFGFPGHGGRMVLRSMAHTLVTVRAFRSLTIRVCMSPHCADMQIHIQGY